jgi:hypothetical protein
MPPPLAPLPGAVVLVVPATPAEPAPPAVMPIDPLAPAITPLAADDPPEDCGALAGVEPHATTSKQQSQ